jgi:twitching motility two-component system response regulator PilH
VKGEILIVEDHPTMRAVMRSVLDPQGYEIREAADGQTALRMARDQPPDLMFLDLHIPGVSGADVLRQVKGDPELSKTRVIVVTATGEEGREFVLSLGADGYFTKPFSLLELLPMVEKTLAEEPAVPAEEPEPPVEPPGPPAERP